MRSTIVHRIFDVGLVLLAAPVALPLCLALMVMIRRDTPGNALFVQRRVGRHQVPFRLYKLRTMASDTGDRPSHEVGAAPITSVGRLLRRTKLDELPQLWNILKGDMTFVGPRPCLPTQQLLIEERASRGLFERLPGITGPAQVRGIDMATPVAMAEVEAEYYARSTVATDAKIVLLTLFGAGSGDAASKIR